MKKTLFIILFSVFLSLLLIMQGSCKHEPVYSCDMNPVHLTLSKTDASANQNDGTIIASANGGKDIQFSLNGNAFSRDSVFINLEPFNNYVVVARSAWGCTDTAMISIGVTDPCKGIIVTVSATKTDAALNQNNGSIKASASGGTGFTYSLNNGPYQANGNFTGLAAGDYVVSAKNSTGCTGTKAVTIGSADPCSGVTVTVSTTLVNPSNNLSNGSITASAAGGSGFTYSLNGGTYQNSGSFTGLAAGTYTVTAKNSNGCIGVKQVTLGSTDPCAGVTVTVTATLVNPSNNQSNGSITASATGGSGFTYSLNGGAYQSSGSFTGLAAGTYTVTAKNSTGCIGTKQVSLTATSACSNTNITLTSTVSDVIPCGTTANNGSITANAGGSSGFTYNLNGGAYQASNIFSSMAAGNYVLGVKDVNGCTKTTNVTVGTAAGGAQFTAARNVIFAKCGPCHINGGSSAGVNYDNVCSIVNGWQKIRDRAVSTSVMPPSGSPALTAAEKKALSDWINGGHTYTN